jgi:spore coat protein H
MRVPLPRPVSSLLVGFGLFLSMQACADDKAAGTRDTADSASTDELGLADTSDQGDTSAEVGVDSVAPNDTADSAEQGDTGPGVVVDRPEGWTTATHSNEVPPNFVEVFSDTEVKRIDIDIGADQWEAMMADMTEIYGEPTGGGPGGGPGGGFSDRDPIFVPATVHYGDHTWTHVGVRFKGNSSLRSTWTSGNLKLSFKLDFDQYEDQFPEVDDQRFYGFKKLSLKNNFQDSSLAREKVMTDLFRAGGLAASHTSFCAVYVDRGDGPEYFGLYTLVEEVDDTLIETQFEDGGNLYQPDGTAAQLSAGSFNEEELGKETNEDEADYSDVLALLEALHDGTRTSNPEAWRAGLDAIFDTDVFLHYLAINGIGQNWDTYGRMTHNYFIYRSPSTSKLTWIPWDNNEALQAGKQGGSLPLDFAGVQSSRWPLIGFLYADPVYRAKYQDWLRQTIDGPFTVAALTARYDAYEALLAPYAEAERPGFTFLRDSAAFGTAFDALRTHAQSRVTATRAYLGL